MGLLYFHKIYWIYNMHTFIHVVCTCTVPYKVKYKITVQVRTYR